MSCCVTVCSCTYNSTYDEYKHTFCFLHSRKASESKSDGTIDHMPVRQTSEDSQTSLKEITRRYPRVSVNTFCCTELHIDDVF